MPLLPFHPAAESVLGPPRPMTLRELAAAVALLPEDVAADLAATLDLSAPESATPVEPAALHAAADREAELLGDIRIRCHHLLLGALRALGADAALNRAREDFQILRGARGFTAYATLEPPALAASGGGRQPVAVLLAGIPGTGKSTLAESLARRLRAPLFSMDWQLGALVPFGVLRPDTTEPLEEAMLTASLARQLQLGLDVLLDATAHRHESRRRWRTVAERLGARFLGVECVCSDATIHRSRIEGRSRTIPHWPATVTWDLVGHMRSRWEPWNEPHLVLDSAHLTPEASAQRVLDELSADPAVERA